MKALLSITLPATLEQLGALLESVRTCAEHQGFDKEKISEIELVVEEALVNVCSYAYPDCKGDVTIDCLGDDKRFVIEMSDTGVPFDMTALPDPDVTAGTDERPIGGLGVYLIKKVADAVTYHRKENRNILHLVINMGKGQ